VLKIGKANQHAYVYPQNSLNLCSLLRARHLSFIATFVINTRPPLFLISRLAPPVITVLNCRVVLSFCRKASHYSQPLTTRIESYRLIVLLWNSSVTCFSRIRFVTQKTIKRMLDLKFIQWWWMPRLLTVFCDVTPNSPVVHRRFGGTCCLHLQGESKPSK
jgi:hypothetical protein